jgi:hypothetical protein
MGFSLKNSILKFIMIIQKGVFGRCMKVGEFNTSGSFPFCSPEESGSSPFASQVERHQAELVVHGFGLPSAMKDEVQAENVGDPALLKCPSGCFTPPTF